jgi:hypothetical protein
MKKNELVHLHALLVRVAEDYVARGEATPEAFAPYRDLGVTPMALRESRARHEAAVRTLAALLADRSVEAADVDVDVEDAVEQPREPAADTGSEPDPRAGVDADADAAVRPRPRASSTSSR